MPQDMLDAVRVSEHVVAGLKRFPFFIQHRECLARTSYHIHPGIEIDITHEGRGNFRVGHGNELQIPRQVIVFSGDLPHQFVADPGKAYRRTVICIEPSGLECARGTLSKLTRSGGFSWRLDPASYGEIERYCAMLAEEMWERRIEWESVATGLLLQILALLRRSQVSDGFAAPGEGVAQGSNDLVQACRDYIRANLGEPLSLSTLADTFCVSRGHLARTFRRETGMTLHEYLAEERISEAKRLIATQRDMSITVIALQVGFQSLSHFCRTFRQHVGCTPTTCRKLLGHA